MASRIQKRYDRSLSFGENLWSALARGLQDIGDEIFTRSQRRVPVDTGNLKKSGYIEYLGDGVRIGYRANYAAVVERGMQGQYVFVRSHNVGAHSRRVRRGGGVKWVNDIPIPEPVRTRKHQVKSHRRQSHFRRYAEGREGKFYLQSSVDDVFESGRALGILVKQLLWTLNKYGRTIKK